MNDTPDIKPGYATTEFWLALGNVLVNAVAALLAILHPGFHLNPNVQGLIVAIAPLAAMLGASFYALSRAKVKAAALAPAPVVITPGATTTTVVAPAPAPASADCPPDPPAPQETVVTKEGDHVRGAPRRAPRTRKAST